jgi:two-component sensor histidine kinase
VDEIATSLAVAIQHARLYEQARRDAAAKAMLLQEVNHRVGNNLLAILGILSLEKQRARQAETIPFSVLEDIYARIDSMGTVHRMLSAGQWEPLNLANLVTQIIEAALSGSPIQDRIAVTVIAPESEPIPITPKEGTTLAMIINELTTNSIKHAFQGRETGHLQVQISVAAEPAKKPVQFQVQLCFRDDGPGWSEAVLAGKHQNIGLKLVRLNVTEALNGQLTLINENGAVALIIFQPTLLG